MGSTKSYNPSLPIDMGQLNTITEGKSTYQAELLELFFLNSAECILVLERNSIPNGSPEKWKAAIEELKNISNSIGALELSKVCAVAEKMGNASGEEKAKVLASVRSHIQRLRAFLRNTSY